MLTKTCCETIRYENTRLLKINSKVAVITLNTKPKVDYFFPKVTMEEGRIHRKCQLSYKALGNP